MAGPNINVILSANILVQDVSGGGSQQIVNRNLGNPTLPATVVFYDPFFQAAVGGSSVSLPIVGGLGNVYVVYVKNLHASALLVVSYQNTGSATNHTMTLAPGGIFMYFNPAEPIGTGMQNLVLTGTGATIPACVLVAV